MVGFNLRRDTGAPYLASEMWDSSNRGSQVPRISRLRCGFHIPARSPAAIPAYTKPHAGAARRVLPGLLPRGQRRRPHRAAWAARRDYPFLSVRAYGDALRSYTQGHLSVLELPRGPVSFALDRDLRFDLLFARHSARIERALRAFRPDIVHITGPSEMGMLGAALAHRLGIPLAASWHTNVHQYAARRSQWALGLLPAALRAAAAARVEAAALRASGWLYRQARVLFAPNPELCHLLADLTGRSCFVMPRGINATLFNPTRRTAPPPGQTGAWTLGYVGRLSIEKNVAVLPRIAAALRDLGWSSARGWKDVRFVIIGQGAEEAALRLALPSAHFPGVLRGEALATAYANMDLFVFPSHTDTFGNAVLEAMASGVPAVVTATGGPAHLVRSADAENTAGAGLVAPDDEAFAPRIASILADPQHHAAMCLAARRYAEKASWDTVFEGVYAGYAAALPA